MDSSMSPSLHCKKKTIQSENNVEKGFCSSVFNFEESETLPYDMNDPLEVRIHKWLDSFGIEIVDPQDNIYRYYEEIRKSVIDLDDKYQNSANSSPIKQQSLGNQKKSLFSLHQCSINNFEDYQSSTQINNEQSYSSQNQQKTCRKVSFQVIPSSKEIIDDKTPILQEQFSTTESTEHKKNRFSFPTLNLISIKERGQIHDSIGSADFTKYIGKKSYVNLFIDIDCNEKKRANSFHKLEQHNNNNNKQEGILNQFQGSTMMQKRRNMLKKNKAEQATEQCSSSESKEAMKL